SGPVGELSHSQCFPITRQADNLAGTFSPQPVPQGVVPRPSPGSNTSQEYSSPRPKASHSEYIAVARQADVIGKWIGTGGGAGVFTVHPDNGLLPPGIVAGADKYIGHGLIDAAIARRSQHIPVG